MLLDALTDNIRFSSAQKNRIPLVFPVDVYSWFSSPSMSGGVFHLAVFRRPRKHKENRQKWMHIDVWTRFSSHGCQKSGVWKCTYIIVLQYSEQRDWGIRRHCTHWTWIFLWSSTSIPWCPWPRSHDSLLMQTVLFASLLSIITKPQAKLHNVNGRIYCTTGPLLECKNMQLGIIKTVLAGYHWMAAPPALIALQTPLAQQLITAVCTYQCVRPFVLELHPGTNLWLVRSVQRQPQTHQLNWHSAFCSLVFQNTQGLVLQSPMRGSSRVKSPDPCEGAEAIITGQHIWFIGAPDPLGMVIKYSQGLPECDAKKHQHPTYILWRTVFSGLIRHHEYFISLWVYQNCVKLERF